MTTSDRLAITLHSRTQASRSVTGRDDDPLRRHSRAHFPQRNGHMDIDQARLLPRYRDRSRVSTHPVRIIETMDEELTLVITNKNKTLVPSPGELRGIPVIGHGGAIPGSQPEQATIRNSDRAA